MWLNIAVLVLALSQSGSNNYNVRVNFVDPSSSLYDAEILLFLDTTATTIAQVISDAQTAILNYASAASYSITAGDIQWGPLSGASRTFNAPTRSLNSAFQISAHNDSVVAYTVDIASALTLTTGQSGQVVLEYADDSGFTTNVVTVQTSTNGNTGTLSIGINTTQTATATLTGVIPAGKYVRIRTVNVTGTPTFTYRNASEVLI